MRKLIYYIAVSVEGYYKTTDGKVPEQFEPTEPEHQYANDLLRDADGLVFGRGMYEVMSYWDNVDVSETSSPRVEREFAELYQHKHRHVFSQSLASVDSNATLHHGDAPARVAQLKDEAGSFLLLGCGTALLAELLQARLVDEVRLLVMPILLGDGVSLLPRLSAAHGLTLNSADTFESGSVLLSYRVTA